MSKTEQELFAEAAQLAATHLGIPLGAVESVQWSATRSADRPHKGCTALLCVLARLRTRPVRFNCYLLSEKFHGSTRLTELKLRTGRGWVTYAHLQERGENFGGLEL